MNNFSNPKAQTLKMLREGFRKTNKDQLVDIVLACAHYGANLVTNAERVHFERYIMDSPHDEISQEIKDALADLSDDEKQKLFT